MTPRSYLKKSLSYSNRTVLVLSKFRVEKVQESRQADHRSPEPFFVTILCRLR